MGSLTSWWHSKTRATSCWKWFSCTLRCGQSCLQPCLHPTCPAKGRCRRRDDRVHMSALSLSLSLSLSLFLFTLFLLSIYYYSASVNTLLVITHLTPLSLPPLNIFTILNYLLVFALHLLLRFLSPLYTWHHSLCIHQIAVTIPNHLQLVFALHLLLCIYYFFDHHSVPLTYFSAFPSPGKPHWSLPNPKGQYPFGRVNNNLRTNTQLDTWIHWNAHAGSSKRLRSR